MIKNILWFGLLRSDILIEKAMKNTVLGAIIGIAYIIVIIWLIMRAEKNFLKTLPGFIIVLVLTGIAPFISLLGAFGVFALIAFIANACKVSDYGTEKKESDHILKKYEEEVKKYGEEREEREKKYNKRQEALEIARRTANQVARSRYTSDDDRYEIMRKLHRLESSYYQYDDPEDVEDFINELEGM